MGPPLSSLDTYVEWSVWITPQEILRLPAAVSSLTQPLPPRNTLLYMYIIIVLISLQRKMNMKTSVCACVCACVCV